MSKLYFFIALSITTSFSHAAFLTAEDLPEKKRTQAGLYLMAKDAYAQMNEVESKYLFIDVRTRAEVGFTGMPIVADINIPFKLLDADYGWDEKRQNFTMFANPAFVSRTITALKQKHLSKHDRVYVMCRSGARSAKAADALTAAGFTQVISIVDGYEGDKAKTGAAKGKRVLNGWKNSQLPWTEKLQKDKMYLLDQLRVKDKAINQLEKMDTDKNGIISQQELQQGMTK